MIKILNHTQNPLIVVGTNAGVCYNTEIKDEEHARRIAKHCIRAEHGRNLEFVDLTIEVSGYSARMVRELFRHVIGTSFLQSSTRYITYTDFDYYIPTDLDGEARHIYIDTMLKIIENYEMLKKLGVENDITGYILPLAMTTTFVMKINARALANLANQRMCVRALPEFRDFMLDLKTSIKGICEEWEWLANVLMVPKCAKTRYCIEGKKDCMFPPKEKKESN